jgi:hypothetical protein
VALETGIPIAFGVLTTDTIEQAIERSGTKAGNKGFDAAVAANETANLLRAVAALGGAPERSGAADAVGSGRKKGPAALRGA